MGPKPNADEERNYLEEAKLMQCAEKNAEGYPLKIRFQEANIAEHDALNPEKTGSVYQEFVKNMKKDNLSFNPCRANMQIRLDMEPNQWEMLEHLAQFAKSFGLEVRLAAQVLEAPNPKKKRTHLDTFCTFDLAQLSFSLDADLKTSLKCSGFLSTTKDGTELPIVDLDSLLKTGKLTVNTFLQVTYTKSIYRIVAVLWSPAKNEIEIEKKFFDSNICGLDPAFCVPFAKQKKNGGGQQQQQQPGSSSSPAQTGKAQPSGRGRSASRAPGKKKNGEYGIKRERGSSSLPAQSGKSQRTNRGRSALRATKNELNEGDEHGVYIEKTQRITRSRSRAPGGEEIQERTPALRHLLSASSSSSSAPVAPGELPRPVPLNDETANEELRSDERTHVKGEPLDEDKAGASGDDEDEEDEDEGASSDDDAITLSSNMALDQTMRLIGTVPDLGLLTKKKLRHVLVGVRDGAVLVTGTSLKFSPKILGLTGAACRLDITPELPLGVDALPEGWDTPPPRHSKWIVGECKPIDIDGLLKDGWHNRIELSIRMAGWESVPSVNDHVLPIGCVLVLPADLDHVACKSANKHGVVPPLLAVEAIVHYTASSLLQAVPALELELLRLSQHAQLSAASSSTELPGSNQYQQSMDVEAPVVHPPSPVPAPSRFLVGDELEGGIIQYPPAPESAEEDIVTAADKEKQEIHQDSEGQIAADADEFAKELTGQAAAAPASPLHTTTHLAPLPDEHTESFEVDLTGDFSA